MSLATRVRAGVAAAVLGLGASSALAAEAAPAHSHPGHCWHAMHWPGYWWTFPLAFFVLMFVMWAFAWRRGPRGWRWWCPSWATGSRYDVAESRSANGPEESALEALNRRLARGEIDKREYDEIKATISDRE